MCEIFRNRFGNPATFKVISKEEQRKYLRNNFTKVKLNGEKKKFLEIDWPYIYTLNADDAIERIFPPYSVKPKSIDFTGLAD